MHQVSHAWYSNWRQSTHTYPGDINDENDEKKNLNFKNRKTVVLDREEEEN